MRLLVVGGGAAGFFCAVNAARMNPALEVTILEKSSKLLSKVRISGGGRCNVTHACFSIDEMTRSYPRGYNFVKKTFHQFFTTDTIKWFEERNVFLKTEKDGRMFPTTDSSETIIECLLREARRYNVNIRLNSEVKSLRKNGDLWNIQLADGNETADYVCVACGGYPKSSMFGWLTDLGHTIIEPVPSLFTFNMPSNKVTALMGIATPARIKISGTKFEEVGPVLVTHWGLSGPAVLKLSARAARDLAALAYTFNVLVNWTGSIDEQSIREHLTRLRTTQAAAKIYNRNQFDIPQRLWEYLCSLSGIHDNVRWADLSATMLKSLVKHLYAHDMRVEGKTTYKEEFVTAGGVLLTEVDSSSMESRLQPGLYFAGEILDVDGVTGGFNFQHAWTSGWIAALAISKGG